MKEDLEVQVKKNDIIIFIFIKCKIIYVLLKDVDILILMFLEDINVVNVVFMDMEL
jgi:hypothetical protein